MTNIPKTLRRYPTATPRGASEATTYALTAACALAEYLQLLSFEKEIKAH